MASPDAGARPPQLPTDESSDSNLSELPTLESSGHDRRGACRWRTARHYDRECSRYFDCPSHIVERALSDGEPEETDGGHQEQVEAGPSSAQDHDPEPHSDSDAVSSLSEDADEDDGDERPRSPSPEAPAGTDEVTERPLRDSQPPERAVFQSQNSDHGLVSPALPTMPFLRTRTQAEPDSGLHVPPVSSPTRRGGVVFEPPMTGRPVSGSASPTRMVSRISPSPSATPGPSRPPEVSLPRWQPDSEVTYCPICGTQFSFFIRKHHCRKCGRVVCNSCSPHRITIPYQYIVRPPGATLPVAQGASLSLLDSQGWYPEFGGERVRLCNPCVPDPNTAPPQRQGLGGPSRSDNDLGSAAHTDSNALARLGLYLGTGLTNVSQGRGRSVTVHHGVMPLPRRHLQPPRSNDNRILWGTPPAYTRAASSSQPTQAHPNSPPRYRSMLDVDFPNGYFPAGPSSSSAPNVQRRHPARSQIPEEDECPVCHRELPPRSLPNFEALREAHINGCITSHSRYGGSPATTLGDTDGDDSLPPPVPPRRTGMFPYTATEKDCVDSAECSICLEEFEAGVAMARLECLCRFHRRCIDAWWERHPGRCPMHQHDGFGY